MSEYQPRTFCWSCGKSQADCICDDGFIANLVTPPNEILPICGGKSLADGTPIKPWANPDRFSEVMPRPCCKCDEEWLCTHDTWIYGKCPNCGAKGIDGGDPYGYISPKMFPKFINKPLFLPSMKLSENTFKEKSWEISIWDQSTK